MVTFSCLNFRALLQSGKLLKKAHRNLPIRLFASNVNEAERTALYEFHKKNNGQIVNFGGFSLPVKYGDQSITASHLFTRQHASIFDVSHMLQTYIRGKDAISCIESICTADIHGLKDGNGTLTVFTNDSGGILDDLIVNRINNECLYIVSNAALKRQDMDLMNAAVSKYKFNGSDVDAEFLTPSTQSLISVQGPSAVSILSKLLPNADLMKSLYFMSTCVTEIAGVPGCRITRCGYTGEDGVEISVDSQKVEYITEALLAIGGKEEIAMAGLGARDSLRLEAGLCLYGSDIDETKTPAEAGLAWLVAKRRRNELNFPGAKYVCDQLKSGMVTHRRVGLLMTDSNVPPARAGFEVYNGEQPIGKVTSGCPSPSLKQNIAMGYVEENFKALGTSLKIKIRNNLYNAKITKMPFVKTNYYTKPKNQ